MLAIDMGLGKTIIILTAIAETKRRALIIAPLRVIYNVWRQEAMKWDHTRHLTFDIIHGDRKHQTLVQSKADVLLINYEGVHWLWEKGWRALDDIDWLICDESSALKNWSTKRFKTMKYMVECFENRTMLSGTPAPNCIINLWAQFRLLDDGERLHPNITYFKNQYTYQWGRESWMWSMRPGADERIYGLVEDICIRLDAKDYLQLPDMVTSMIMVDLPKDIKGMYDEFEKELLFEMSEDANLTATNAAILSLKLRQILQGAVYYDREKDRAVLPLHTAKIEALQELVEQLQGRPVLVAFQFRFEEEMLKTAFGDKTPIISGGANESEVVDIVTKWNRGEIPILAAHPAAMSHGLNLQDGGADIVWLATTWSLEQYQQMNARLHRQGQKRPVTVHHICVTDSVDQVVIKALTDKDKSQAAFLNAMKEYTDSRRI